MEALKRKEGRSVSCLHSRIYDDRTPTTGYPSLFCRTSYSSVLTIVAFSMERCVSHPQLHVRHTEQKKSSVVSAKQAVSDRHGLRMNPMAAKRYCLEKGTCLPTWASHFTFGLAIRNLSAGRTLFPKGKVVTPDNRAGRPRRHLLGKTFHLDHGCKKDSLACLAAYLAPAARPHPSRYGASTEGLHRRGRVGANWPQLSGT